MKINKAKFLYYFLVYLIILLVLIPVLIVNVFGVKEKFEIVKYVEGNNDKIKLYLKESKEVCVLDFEEYVAGVTYAEMPASFETEALKAQAVAARTYTYRKMQENTHEFCDMCDDVNHCQAFRKPDGSAAFTKVKMAVEETKGEIIVYNNEPINAVFHAASGGFTEDAATVWSGDVEYLVSTKSSGEEEIMKDFETKVVVSKKDFFEMLGIRDKKDNPKVTKRSDAGGVIEVKVGEKIFTGNQIRSLCRLRSTKFEIECDNDNIIFNVRGYGHGVGLSQWGAEAMAREGSTYDKIIKHYYKGVELVEMKNI